MDSQDEEEKGETREEEREEEEEERKCEKETAQVEGVQEAEEVVQGEGVEGRACAPASHCRTGLWGGSGWREGGVWDLKVPADRKSVV